MQEELTPGAVPGCTNWKTALVPDHPAPTLPAWGPFCRSAHADKKQNPYAVSAATPHRNQMMTTVMLDNVLYMEIELPL